MLDWARSSRENRLAGCIAGAWRVLDHPWCRSGLEPPYAQMWPPSGGQSWANTNERRGYTCEVFVGAGSWRSVATQEGWWGRLLGTVLLVLADAWLGSEGRSDFEKSSSTRPFYLHNHPTHQPHDITQNKQAWCVTRKMASHRGGRNTAIHQSLEVLGTTMRMKSAPHCAPPSKQHVGISATATQKDVLGRS